MVDGGYAENSGLGLIADAPDLVAQGALDYNTFRRQTGEPLVVSFVMYIQNSLRLSSCRRRAIVSLSSKQISKPAITAIGPSRTATRSAT